MEDICHSKDKYRCLQRMFYLVKSILSSLAHCKMRLGLLVDIHSLSWKHIRRIMVFLN